LRARSTYALLKWSVLGADHEPGSAQPKRLRTRLREHSARLPRATVVPSAALTAAETHLDTLRTWHSGSSEKRGNTVAGFDWWFAQTVPTALWQRPGGDYLAALLEGGSRYVLEDGWPGAVARFFDALDAAAYWSGGHESGWQTEKLSRADTVLRTIQRRWARLTFHAGEPGSRLAPHSVVGALAQSFVDSDPSDLLERSIDLLSASLAIHATRLAAPELQHPLDQLRLTSPHSFAGAVMKVYLGEVAEDDALWALGFSAWEDDESLATARNIIAALTATRTTFWSFAAQLNIDADGVHSLVEQGWFPPRSTVVLGRSEARPGAHGAARLSVVG
jgi:hypothetical protein